MADLSSLEARADDAERRLAALEIAAKGSGEPCMLLTLLVLEGYVLHPCVALTGSTSAASSARAAPQGLQQQLQRLHQTLLSAKKEQLLIEKELAEVCTATLWLPG